jgi:pyridoxine 4-dehydrogenase
MRITGQGIWGPPRDESESIALLRRVVDSGIAFIDTAEPSRGAQETGH